MEQTEQKLILLQGPPACGKSTIAIKEQAKDVDGSVIVSRDSFRDGRGKYWVPKQESYITALEQFAVDQALRMGYTVIVDATNMNPGMIRELVAMAEARFVPVWGWMVHETLENCLDRDNNITRSHHVGPMVIRNFYKKYQDYCRAHNLEMVPGTISKYLIYNPLNCQHNHAAYNN